MQEQTHESNTLHIQNLVFDYLNSSTFQKGVVYIKQLLKYHPSLWVHHLNEDSNESLGAKTQLEEILHVVFNDYKRRFFTLTSIHYKPLNDFTAYANKDLLIAFCTKYPQLKKHFKKLKIHNEL